MSNLIQELWDEHVAWSLVAGRLKSQRAQWRLAALILTTSGAMLQTLAATVPACKQVAGVIGTIFLVLVPIIGHYFLTAKKTSNWLRARSISEAIKSEIYLYQAGAYKYRNGEGLGDLQSVIRRMRDLGKDMGLEMAKIGSPSKPAPPRLISSDYVEKRVREQIENYYRRKAKKLAKRSGIFRNTEIFLISVAAILGACATVFEGLGGALGPWVAVITTLGGAIATHAAAERFDFQATIYFATARELNDLIQDWIAGGSPDEASERWPEFVSRCEAVISAENRAWMAKLDAPVPLEA